MTTYSVSKGSFLFLPQSQGKKKKRTNPLSGSFEPLPMETKGHTQQRQEAYTTCWSEVKGKIEGVMSRQHDRIFTDLVNFISASHKKLTALRPNKPTSISDHHDSAAAIAPSSYLPPRLEVPTAVLLAGVNMPDHDVLFEQLKSRIHKEISPHVVQLRSKDCNSGMKVTMKEILLQLMQTEQSPGCEDSDMEEDDSSRLPKSSRSLPQCSMPLLSAWYTESCGEGSEFPPVVIIIEDFEGFVPRILCDLVTSLSPHLPEFPVVLVLGVATSLSAIHRALPRSASSLLCIEQFHADHSTLTLAQLLREVLLSSSLPFKLGPKSFHFLVHHFLYCSFSLTGFTQGLHCAAMEHFYWQPLSVLCGGGRGGGSHWKEWVGGMSHGHCEMVRATPSFQSYVVLQEPQVQVELLEEDAQLQVTVLQLLQDLERYHECFFPLLCCLYHLTKPLPGAPLGKRLHDVYQLSLEQAITEGDKFQSVWSLLGMLGRDELTSAVSSCVDIIGDSLSSHPKLEVLSHALQLFTSFTQALEEVDKAVAESVTDELPGGHSTRLIVQETTSERKMRFQERLRQISSRKKEPTAYENLRTSLLESLLQVFKSHLRCASSLPLHEVFYFDNVSSLRKHLSASPRSAIQVALSTPKYYLPCASNVSEQRELSANMPDICIVYQLHLECGRLINLFDWLQAFIAVVQPEKGHAGKTASESKEKKSKPGKEEVDTVLHARFIQAVSELQFLGFVKPTLRKTDHVQRLTWGTC